MGETTLAQQKYRHNLKIEVLTHYSDTAAPRCKVCHIEEIELLSIDHINEDANHHKGVKHCPGSYARYLHIRNYWPDNLQVLCHNHNSKKAIIHRRIKAKDTWDGLIRRDNIKLDIFNHYGNKCNECGETDIMCLSIDHIKNNGAQHRKEEKITSGTGTYRWLKKNNYPSGFQLLCFNCNKVKEIKRVKKIHR